MKRCRDITCWTDYPFTALGDIPGQKAPIRHVYVVGYDMDKYATVSLSDGSHAAVKSGYLYSQPGRLGQVKNINRRKLERMVQPARSIGTKGSPHG